MLPTLGQVREASNWGCATCQIVDSTILKFDLVKLALGWDREMLPDAAPGRWDFTDDDGIKRAYVDVETLRVRIKPDVAKDEEKLPPRLLISLYGNKGYETEHVWIYTTQGNTQVTISLSKAHPF